MKSHMRIKLREAVGDPPHWADVIAGTTTASRRLHPTLDAIFDRFGVPVFVTTEFARRGPSWSPDEIAAGLNRIYRVVMEREGDFPPGLAQEISAHPLVEYARVGRVGIAPLPSFATAFGRTTGQASRDAIFLPDAHRDFSRGRPDVTIAVLDTGLDLGHHEFRGRIRPGADFVNIIDGAQEFIGDYLDADPEPEDQWVGHGTHVAGVAAGGGVNMPPGVAPLCSLLPVRVLGAMRRGSQVVGAGAIDNIDVAVKWAVDQKADVINMSLGVLHEGGGLPHAEVVAYAARHGVTVVAASGNDGQNAHYYPAGLPHVITVGAADAEGRPAAFSTWGDHVDLLAPGTDIYSSFLRDGYAFSTGTSHASPFVSGAVALLRSHSRACGQALGDRRVKEILKATADRPDTRLKHPRAGYGALNMLDALRLLDHQMSQKRATFGGYRHGQRLESRREQAV